jgi:CRP/FNR family transcriptional regulator, anaerobic regulatory protein
MGRPLLNVGDVNVPDATTASLFGNPAHPFLTGDRWPDVLQELGISVAALPQMQSTARARQTLLRAGERMVGVPLLSEGWAARVSRLPDGRRQILSFVLPGDLISAAAVFSEKLPFFIEAVTPVHCVHYDRDDFSRQMAANPSVFAALIKLLLDAKECANQLAVDLGRRDATGRIARLMLHLKGRLEVRGFVVDDAFDLPLRQQHIADATGLTSVHVNRVFCALRQDGLIDVRDGRLSILDLPGLRARADLS